MSEGIPECFDWQFIAFESDKNIRSNARLVEDVINDEKFKGFSENLETFLKTAAIQAY